MLQCYLHKEKFMNAFITGSASARLNKKYLQGVDTIATYLAKKGYGVFCVGTSAGSIGAFYHAFCQHSENATLLVPIAYADEVNGMNKGKRIVVDTLFNLQEIGLRNSQVTLVLPGGNGTLGELYMATDLKKSKFDDDLVIIYNINGFYDKIKEMNDFMLEAGSLEPFQYEYFNFCNTPEEVIELLEKNEKKKKQKV